jgi:hypothetical protein
MRTSIMTQAQRDALTRLVWSLVPELKAVIAGGFAAAWWQAEDVDLWVLGDPHLEKAGDVLRLYEVRYEQNETPDYGPAVTSHHATLTAQTPLLPIHIIGTHELSTDALLKTFDISTHRWALTRAGATVAGEHATTIHEPGRVLCNPFPVSTEHRRRKLSARYEIDIAALAPKALKVAQETV